MSKPSRSDMPNRTERSGQLCRGLPACSSSSVGARVSIDQGLYQAHSSMNDRATEPIAHQCRRGADAAVDPTIGEEPQSPAIAPRRGWRGRHG